MKDSKRTILYVDDEEINLFIFEKNFQSDYSIITANSGTDALDKLNSHSDEITIVISDMRMPGMSGVDFITEAKKLHEKITYFILTGYEYDDEIEEAIGKNIVQKCFLKPLDVDEITSSIISYSKN